MAENKKEVMNNEETKEEKTGFIKKATNAIGNFCKKPVVKTTGKVLLGVGLGVAGGLGALAGIDVITNGRKYVQVIPKNQVQEIPESNVVETSFSEVEEKEPAE